MRSTSTRSERKLDIRRRVELQREVCAGVAHAHQHLVVHCDIKPANIIVTLEGRPKLIDFGVARIQDVADARPEGFTRAYTSPQRLNGAPATVADDVYSLGVILRELLTGTPVETDEKLRQLPPELFAIIEKSTAEQTEARYASVAALDDDLRRWLECRPVAAMGDDWTYRSWKLVQRHPWRVAAATLALVSLIGALAIIATLYAGANAARIEAEHRFSEVRALANYMLFDLDSRLETHPRDHTGTPRDGRSQPAISGRIGRNRRRQFWTCSAKWLWVWRVWPRCKGVPGKAHVGEPAAAKANLERAERCW